MSAENSVRKPIAAMKGYVPGEQPQAGKFIKLNTNENPYPPSPQVTQAIQQTLERGLQRYPDPVATSFRIRAGQVYGVDPDSIICGNGSDDILTILTRTFVGEGDELRLPYPSYILYRNLAEIQNAKWSEVHFDSNWKLPADFVANQSKLKLAFLPNPNSPTGTVLTREEIQELASKLNCPLVVDEAYADFAETNCIDLVKSVPNLIVTRTLSKSYALAGLRFGFAVANPKLVYEMQKVKDSYNCDSLSISGAVAAVGDQAWLRDNVAKIRKTRESLEQGLVQLGFRIIPSQANFVWCEHPGKSSESIYLALKQQHILVRYMKYPGWREGLRISVGTDEQINALLGLLPSILA